MSQQVSDSEEELTLLSIKRLVLESFKHYVTLRGPLVSAAITFYALLAATPTLVLGTAIAGMALGDQHARQELLGWIIDYTGKDGGQAVEQFLLSVDYFEGGWVAAVGGVVVLLFSASRLFAALQHGLNQVWGVRLRPDRSVKKVARGLLKKRLLSFLLVFSAGLMLTAGLVARAFWNSFFSDQAPAWQVALSQIVSEMVIMSVLMAAVFVVVLRLLPDARVKWEDAAIGGLSTAVFFSLGALLAGLYLQHVTSSSALGAAGTLAVLLLWMNYCAHVFFFGATFTHAWALHRGHGVEPEPHAVRVEPANES